MLTVSREQLKTDAVYNKVLQGILKSHKPPDHTRKNLMDLKEIPDVCEETEIFAQMGDRSPLWISYIVTTWIQPEEKGFVFPTRVEAVTFYDDFQEYNTNRLRKLNAADRESRNFPDVQNEN